jgi:CheY-like chemotaxis protein
LPAWPGVSGTKKIGGTSLKKTTHGAAGVNKVQHANPRAAQDLVGASKICRDITAPLRNAAKLLCRNSSGPQTQIACEIMDRQLRQMTRLVDDLLDVSRIDGMAAVEEAETFRPDVVIVDIDMPKLNGYQVARVLKGRAWAHETLLIAMTGWAQETDRERGRQAGFHAHLLKPVRLDALQGVLTEGTSGTS